MMVHKRLHFNHEVAEALKNRLPIVAIESGMISNGLPFPENFNTALLVEQTIRDQGVIPATIAIHQKKIHIGLEEDLLQRLSREENPIRASRRDLAYILSQKLSATTNVAASIFCAHLAKLPILVTGGIGGVRHNADKDFEISSDLIELAATPIAIICSGAKSILDIPKTIETLETYGVPIVGYQTHEFPAFYSHSSGIPLFQRLTTVTEVAKLLICHQQLNGNRGLVIANPIPKAAEIPDNDMKPMLKQAQIEALHDRKTITPSLLQRIAELTAGQSWHAHKELMKSNAKLAAEIAIAHNKYCKEES